VWAKIESDLAHNLQSIHRYQLSSSSLGCYID